MFAPTDKVCIPSVYVRLRLQIRLCSQCLCTFTSADTFVFSVPVFLLAFDATIAGVPTAQIDGFLLTVVALQAHQTHELYPWKHQDNNSSAQTISFSTVQS